jgi:hypothetical protein
MVPLSERRHRLYRHEIPEVVEGLMLGLERLLVARDDLERAEIVFKTLCRRARVRNLIIFCARG